MDSEVGASTPFSLICKFISVEAKSCVTYWTFGTDHYPGNVVILQEAQGYGGHATHRRRFFPGPLVHDSGFCLCLDGQWRQRSSILASSTLTWWKKVANAPSPFHSKHSFRFNSIKDGTFLVAFAAAAYFTHLNTLYRRREIIYMYLCLSL